ncbi:HpcH/HpaI aldolase/citrate lyase family protein [Chloroflexota bacterium]
MVILRSMLFVPGNSMRMIYKAATLPADAIIFDLEDAVPIPEKSTARIIVRDSINIVKSGGPYTFVRLNALATKLTEEDLKLVIVKGLDGVMLAKAEGTPDIVELDRILTRIEKDSSLTTQNIKIIPLIESARGVINAYNMATASKRIVALAFGSGDYYRDLGRSVDSLSQEQTELLYARSHIVNSSVAAGVPAIDTVFFGLLTDREGFVRETMLAARLGFKGKLLIHPTQIEPVNNAFSPSSEETEYARRVVSAFEEARKRGLGAISFEGKMIDYMNYKQVNELVKQADLIAEKERERRENIYFSPLKFFHSIS